MGFYFPQRGGGCSRKVESDNFDASTPDNEGHSFSGVNSSMQII